jgi:hypothetical protein
MHGHTNVQFVRRNFNSILQYFFCFVLGTLKLFVYVFFCCVLSNFRHQMKKYLCNLSYKLVRIFSWTLFDALWNCPYIPLTWYWILFFLMFFLCCPTLFWETCCKVERKESVFSSGIRGKEWGKIRKRELIVDVSAYTWNKSHLYIGVRWPSSVISHGITHVWIHEWFV